MELSGCDYAHLNTCLYQQRILMDTKQQNRGMSLPVPGVGVSPNRERNDAVSVVSMKLFVYCGLTAGSHRRE